MEFVKIVVCALLVAVAYGIVHDQFTIRVSLEYFTIGHPQIFPTTSPTLLALGWGVLATWWVGLPLGFILASTCRNGKRPPLTVSHLRRPIILLVMVMAVGATLSGLVGYALAQAGHVVLPPPLGARVPSEHHSAYVAARSAHLASYVLGTIGGLLLIPAAWAKRRGLAS